jgi:hypothetical protein
MPGRNHQLRGSQGFFAPGGPDVLEGLLADSGLMDVQARVVRAPLRLSSAAEAFEMVQQTFGPIGPLSLTSIRRLARRRGQKSANA